MAVFSLEIRYGKQQPRIELRAHSMTRVRGETCVDAFDEMLRVTYNIKTLKTGLSGNSCIGIALQHSFIHDQGQFIR